MCVRIPRPLAGALAKHYAAVAARFTVDQRQPLCRVCSAFAVCFHRADTTNCRVIVASATRQIVIAKYGSSILAADRENLAARIKRAQSALTMRVHENVLSRTSREE